METTQAASAATESSGQVTGDTGSGNAEGSDAPESIEALALADDEEDTRNRKAKSPVEKKPPEKKKFKLKVYDEEAEYDEDEVVRMAQKAAAADKRFQSAAELEKRYTQAIEKLKQDPRFYFETTGMNAEEWAEKLLIQKLKLETMSPEQRRAYDLEQENMRLKETVAEREAREKEEKEALAKERFERVKSQQAEALDKSISDALQNAGKKVTPRLIARVAHKMLAYHEANDGAQLDPAKAVKLALEDRGPEVNEYLEGLPPEDFDKLPATFLKALREHFVGQVTPPMAQRNPREAGDTAPRRRNRQAMSTDEFFKKLEQKYS